MTHEHLNLILENRQKVDRIKDVLQDLEDSSLDRVNVLFTKFNVKNYLAEYPDFKEQLIETIKAHCMAEIEKLDKEINDL